MTNVSKIDILLLDMELDKKRNQTAFLVLLALSNGPKHGYDISKFIEEKTKGFFRLPFGSLYPVLHKLEKEKLVRASWENKDTQKPKKVYTLTEQGKRQAREEIDLYRTHTIALNRLITSET